MHRILFLGQKPFAEAAWRRLESAEGDRLRVAAVVTNVDAGRVWWGTNQIAREARGRSVIDNAERNVDELLEIVECHDVNLILSVQHPWILPPRVLERVGYQALNFHNAALPAYKGYNAVNHAILAGDQSFTCTVHWMADEVDAGDVAFECSFPIQRSDTALTVYAKAHHAGLRLFDEVLGCLRDGRVPPRRPCPPGGHFHRRSSIVPLRDVSDDSTDQIELKARAFYFPPFEPAYFRRSGTKVYLVPECAWARDGDRAADALRAAIVNTEGTIPFTLG